MIRGRVKKLLIPRYRLVCVVHLGQLVDQCVHVASRCLWDSSHDNFVACEFQNQSLYAVCTVYAVYRE